MEQASTVNIKDTYLLHYVFYIYKHLYCWHDICFAVGDPIIIWVKEGSDPINRFNPLTLCAFCLQPALRFPLKVCDGLFLFSDLRREMILFFLVNDGGIVDHHYFNFLFIKIIHKNSPVFRSSKKKNRNNHMKSRSNWR